MTGEAQLKRGGGRDADARPLIWAVASPRAGEDSQITALAERLGDRWTHQNLNYNALAVLLGVLRASSRLGIRSQRPDPLRPPWPDLIISAGLRNEPVCRWVRRQSGNRTRLVFLGRTWAPANRFDLVVTTPQYRLPRADNIVHNLGTLHAITQHKLAAARSGALQRFADFPQPRIGVLIGGDSGPYAFGPDAARRLARQLNGLRADGGGSVLVTTSRRTRIEAADALEQALDPPRFVYRWNSGEAANPYLCILACADVLVVTGDSVAMMSEAAAAGRSVYVFDTAGGGDRSLRASLYRAMMRWAPERLSRDVALFQAAFEAAGHGVRLGQRAPEPSPGMEGEIGSTVARVRALLR